MISRPGMHCMHSLHAVVLWNLCSLLWACICEYQGDYAIFRMALGMREAGDKLVRTPAANYNFSATVANEKVRVQPVAR